MEPTIGLIVHLHENGVDEKPVPAIITDVKSSTVVDLVVFRGDDGSAAAVVRDVPLSSDDHGRSEKQWKLMPTES
jgi:hypothetical protein